MTTVSSGQTHTISAGITETGDVVLGGGTLDILAGGTADATTVSVGGGVDDSGTVSGTTLAGSLTVFAGGVADATTVVGGVLTVSSGGTASGTIVSTGTEKVYGTDSAATIYDFQEIFSGGSAVGDTVNGGTQRVDAGGTASNTSLVNFGFQDVYGSAISTIVGDGTEQYLESGAFASGTVIDAGGQAFVGSATLEDATISGGPTSGGYLQLVSGSLGSGPVTFAGFGGVLEFDQTTMPTNTISGITTGDLIFLGDTGFQSGGSVTLSAGNVLEVTEGGVTYSLQLDPSQNLSGTYFYLVRDYGTVGTAVLAGQLGVVSSGQTVSNAALSAGHVQGVFGSAVGTTVLTGAMQEVYAGGVAVSATVSSGGYYYWGDDDGGYQQIDSGGTAIGTTLDHLGIEYVLAGGTASGTVLNSQTVQNVYGSAVFTIVNAGGFQTVFGTATSTTVEGGGQEYVSSGGVASATTLHGAQTVYGGGAAYQTTISAGGGQNVTGSSALVSGLASGTTISSAGTQTLGNFGIGIGSLVENGGTQNVNASGTASNTTVDGGGSQTVVGGTAIGTVVSSGGIENVYTSSLLSTIGDFGVTSDTIVESGGHELVSGGGIASDTTLSGGTLELVSGSLGFGTLSGAVTFAGTGGDLQVYGTVMPSATISGFTSGDTIDLGSVAFSSAGSVTLAGGNLLEVIENGATYTLHLDPLQNFAGESFTLSPDGGSGTDITISGTPHANLVVDGGSTAAVGSAGAAAVSFTITGIDTDDNGAVTFTDGAHTATVTITNGTAAASTVDLAGFNDGVPITASLSVTDAASNTLTAVATNLTLDQDLGETATLGVAHTLLGSAGAGAATFVITGLGDDTGPGNTGTATFVEGTHTVTVGVTGDGTYTANLSSLPDGTVTTTLTLTDASGNTFAASGPNITLDQDAGETATLTVDGGATATLGSAGAAAVSFSIAGLAADDNGSVVFGDGQGDTVTVSITNGSAATSTVDLASFADGTLTASLSVTDAAGNTFTAVATNLTLDPDAGETATLTPAATLVGSAGAGAVSFVVSGLDEASGGTGTLTLSDGTATTTVAVAGDGTYTANLSGTAWADGAVSSTLSFTDAAGNTFTAAGTTVTLDKDAGETATLTPAATLVGSAGAGAVSFVVSGLDEASGGTGTLTLSDGAATTTIAVAGDGTYTANLSGTAWADGAVSSTLSFTDAAGNTFTAAGTTVTLDKDAGETATLTVANTSETAGAATATFTITGLGDDTGPGNTGTVEFVEGTQTVTVGVTGDGTYTANLSGLPSGTATTTLSITDAAGNTFAATGPDVTLSPTAQHATLTVDGGSTAAVGSAGASAVSFTITGIDADDNGTVTFTDGAHTATVTITNGTAAASTVDLAGFNDGGITASLSVTDAASNTLTAVATNLTLDQDLGETATLAPAATLVGSAGAGAVSFVVSGLDEASGGTGTLTLSDGAATTTIAVAGDGTYTANLSGTAWADGAVSSTLSFTDAAGNTFTAAGTTVTLDKDAGETATLGLPATFIGSAGATAVTFSLTGLDAADTGAGNTGTVEFVEGTQTVTVGVTGDGTYTANLSGLPDGTVASTLTFTDAAGNTFTAAGPSVTLDRDVGTTLAVSVAGTAWEGQTLTAVVVANDGDATLGYQWQELVGKKWTNISGATASTYVVAESDEGDSLRVITTSADPNEASTSVTSTATAIATDPPPALTIGSASISVAAGGSTTLPISVAGFDSDDTVLVTIKGLTRYELIVDNLDGRTFKGSGAVTLTAAEVDSGLTLYSTYRGTKQPVNTLTITATDSTSGETVSSTGTIVVTDPPASSGPAVQNGAYIANLALLEQYAAAEFPDVAASIGITAALEHHTDLMRLTTPHQTT